MTKSQGLYLKDILDHIKRIESVAAYGEEMFFKSSMHQDAAIRNFEVIGESVKRLDTLLTDQRPDIPWADYAGFRDVLIHQYDKVLVEIVWESITRDLEPCVKQWYG